MFRPFTHRHGITRKFFPDEEISPPRTEEEIKRAKDRHLKKGEYRPTPKHAPEGPQEGRSLDGRFLPGNTIQIEHLFGTEAPDAS